MLDRLIDLFREFFGLFLFVEVLNPYNACVVLRFGRLRAVYHGPKAVFYWPLAIERCFVTSVVRDAQRLKGQTFTLADGVTIYVKLSLSYSISSVEKYLLEVEDAEKSMAESVVGVVQEVLAPRSWTDLNDPERKAEVLDSLVKGLRKEGFRWGIEIERARFSDLVQLTFAGRLIGNNDEEPAMELVG